MNKSEAGKLGYEKTKDRLDYHRGRQSRRARERYANNLKYCPNCGTQLPYEKRHNKFCDQTCSASFNNRGVTRHIKRSRFCECGNPKTLQNKYCDECIKKRVYSNKVTSLDDANHDRIRKRILLEQRGHQCEVCDLTEWRGEAIPLELDHIDGNADNNQENNLRLICPNCHAQTDTYKGANAGKGSTRQKMRRNRYVQGKTY